MKELTWQEKLYGRSSIDIYEDHKKRENDFKIKTEPDWKRKLRTAIKKEDDK
jgi:hypothetical protein